MTRESKEIHEKEVEGKENIEYGRKSALSRPFPSRVS